MNNTNFTAWVFAVTVFLLAAVGAVWLVIEILRGVGAC